MSTGDQIGVLLIVIVQVIAIYGVTYMAMRRIDNERRSSLFAGFLTFMIFAGFYVFTTSGDISAVHNRDLVAKLAVAQITTLTLLVWRTYAASQ